MNIGKGKSGEGNFAKQIGLAEWTVGAFNPTKDELSEYLGADIETEPEYVKETREGSTRATLKFWLENGTLKIPAQFMLEDVEATNKEGDKNQWINQVGMSAWATSEDMLPEWFTKFTDKDKKVTGDKKYRKAYKGEADLMNFLKNMLNKGSNFFSPETDILLDMKKLFRGNFAEISLMLKSEYVGTVMAAAVVNSYDKDGETKYASRIYAREFLPGYAYRTWKEKGNMATKGIQRFVEQIEGHCKDAFFIGTLQDFTPGERKLPEATASMNNSDY